MPRIEAREIVAYGYACDRLGCDTIVATRNEASPPPEGYYIKAGAFSRVTKRGYQRSNPDDLWFCSKDCFVDWAQYGISHSTR